MKKMYVGNLPYKATEEDLRRLFSEYGEIESLRNKRPLNLPTELKI